MCYSFTNLNLDRLLYYVCFKKSATNIILVFIILFFSVSFLNVASYSFQCMCKNKTCKRVCVCLCLACVKGCNYFFLFTYSKDFYQVKVSITFLFHSIQNFGIIYVLYLPPVFFLFVYFSGHIFCSCKILACLLQPFKNNK